MSLGLDPMHRSDERSAPPTDSRLDSSVSTSRGVLRLADIGTSSRDLPGRAQAAL